MVINSSKYHYLYYRITAMTSDQPQILDGPFTIKPQFEPIMANTNGM